MSHGYRLKQTICTKICRLLQRIRTEFFNKRKVQLQQWSCLKTKDQSPWTLLYIRSRRVVWRLLDLAQVGTQLTDKRGCFAPSRVLFWPLARGGALGMTIKGGDRFDHPSCPPPPLALSVRSLSGGRWTAPGWGGLKIQVRAVDHVPITNVFDQLVCPSLMCPLSLYLTLFGLWIIDLYNRMVIISD